MFGPMDGLEHKEDVGLTCSGHHRTALASSP